MEIEQRLENLETRVNYLYEMINRDKFYTNADISATKQSVTEITPYKETKTAYIEDTSITFTGVPEGNMTIFCPVDYTAERVSNMVTVTFEPLTEVTDIAIMIQ